MNIFILPLGIAVFLVSLLIHVLVWNLRYPKNRPQALFVIFLILPALIFFALLAAAGAEGLPFEMTLLDWLAALLLHYSLSSAYILSYPAVEAISPSLAITLLVGGSPKGLRQSDLSAMFKNDILLGPRINDLLQTGLAKEESGWLTLTPKARVLIGFFVLFRRFLGLPTGKG